MKAWKLQECVAHSPGGVTCVSLGRKSGRVMATGGDDRRVKLWAVGKPTCILSLTGHSSSIEATEFSQEEDRVAAGSLSGSIRIWDLEEVKIVRTLSGHTSGISSLDFHPFGNFVVSGSTDTLVKLWDVSRKGCINTYRGHSGGVNVVRFSPDGKWVVSCGEDGAVKLWDLSAGRQLAELTGNTGSVTTTAFHPTVLLLATASTDRTVRLYDLENFTQVAISGSELAAATIRRIAFHPDGVCLYVATSDYLKIYDYETMTCLETVHVGWRAGGGLDDMAIAPSFNQLVGVSIFNCMLSTYVVDIKTCVPFVGETNVVTQCAPEQTCVNRQPSASTDPPCSSDSNAPNGRLGPTDARLYTCCGSSSNSVHSRNRKSFCLVAEENSQNRWQEDLTDPEAQLPYKPSLEDQNDLTDSADITDPEEYDRIFKPNRTVPRSPIRASAPAPFLAPRASSPVSAVPNPVSPRAPKANIASELCPKPASPSPQRLLSDVPFSAPQPVHRVPSITSSRGKRSSAAVEALDLTQPSDLLYCMAEKMTYTKPDARSDRTETPEQPSESDWLTSVRKPHSPFMTVMSSRVKSLSTIRVMWTRENIRTAIETTIIWNDPAVLVDVLSVLSQNSKLWSLDLVSTLLPHLLPLIKSKYSKHVETTCQVVHVILKNFAQLIRQTLDGPAPPGVDLMREERQRKCQECLRHLLSIRTALNSADVAARAGQCGRELAVRFQILA